MQVLFVASEALPFVKTGGLADVIGSLPKALNNNNIDARVILPKYKEIPENFKKKMLIKKSINISLGWRNKVCQIEEIKYQGVIYYFINNDYYFNRDGIYGYCDSFDEAERFAFFSKAVVEALPYLDFKPDIIHLHDWQTALVSLYLKSNYSNNDFYKSIKTIFTIHNLRYQGIFPRNLLGDVLDINQDQFNINGIEYYGSINYLKAGLIYSDYISTVSETYSQEIQYPYYGNGLNGILKARNNKLHGILNGIDVSEYDSSTDPNIFVNYSDYENKLLNKMLLQENLGFTVDKNIPLIAMVSRIVTQKGIELVITVLEEILSENVQFIIQGTGEEKYEKIFRNIAEKYPKKMIFLNTFDDVLSRKVYASSDLFLMPSLFEPCGLGQIIALRYLSVPIVRETGGLKDTIVSFDEFTGLGNGFTFANYNAYDMLYTIRRALKLYDNKPFWEKIISNGKKEDYSWRQSAKRYINLYQHVL
ncbi:MAG: glycogen synthase GlgA [Vulcanibacillus sp.]